MWWCLHLRLDKGIASPIFDKFSVPTCWNAEDFMIPSDPTAWFLSSACSFLDVCAFLAMGSSYDKIIPDINCISMVGWWGAHSCNRLFYIKGEVVHPKWDDSYITTQVDRESISASLIKKWYMIYVYHVGHEQYCCSLIDAITYYGFMMFHVCHDEKWLYTVHEKGHPFIRDSNRCVNDVNIHPYPVGSRRFDFTLSSPHLGFGPRKPSRNDSAKVPPNPTTRGAVWEEVGRGLQMLILDRLESRFGEVFLGGEV